jgi:hypothetical protein
MKGYTAEEVAYHIVEATYEFGEWASIGLDASRFDQHVSLDALKWEHSIYNAIANSKELKRLLSFQLSTKGLAFASDGRIKYTVKGKRMSGDMNTAVGNCLLMCAMLHAYAAHKGVKCRLINNGDDCQVILRKCDVARFSRGLETWFHELGFTMICEKPVYEIEKIEFCQSHPVNTGSGWVMVRKFPLCVNKDSVSFLPLDSGNMRYMLLTSMGKGGLALSGGVPILQSFYSCLIRNGRGVEGGVHPGETYGLVWKAGGLNRQVQPVTPEARYSFYLAFGVVPDMQRAVEKYYDEFVMSDEISHRVNTHSHISPLCV